MPAPDVPEVLPEAVQAVAGHPTMSLLTAQRQALVARQDETNASIDEIRQLAEADGRASGRRRESNAGGAHETDLGFLYSPNEDVSFNIDQRPNERRREAERSAHRGNTGDAPGMAGILRMLAIATNDAEAGDYDRQHERIIQRLKHYPTARRASRMRPRASSSTSLSTPTCEAPTST